VPVAFASQTGTADELAHRTARELTQGGLASGAVDLRHLGRAELERAERMLFVVSTTGEGDAPDSAAAFRDVMGAPALLSHLRYAILALGDRGYAQYCAFGFALDAWLKSSGARPLFDLVDVDDGDPAALRHWQHNLRELTGRRDLADWTTPGYGRWRLVARRHLNPGSPGAPAFHVVLEPLDGAATWSAGDIAEVEPQNAAGDVDALLRAVGRGGDAALAMELARRELPSDAEAQARLAALAPPDLLAALPRVGSREYSIASLPETGRLELLVRQVRRADGRLGLGSGWLTAHAAVGSELGLRVRENRAFHAPADARPLILVGNGTGLAGLRAHLAARVARGRHRNWLLFGERTEQHDYFFREEIERWRAAGALARVDLAFSRDRPERPYVQHLVADHGADVKRWIEDGAALYVCGSLRGMAPAVHAALEAILGAAPLAALSAEGRYRRDVY
jgi:sulfite reductase (NADPH) flavoprotein alpha-component